MVDSNTNKLYEVKPHNHEADCMENCTRNLKREMNVYAEENPRHTPSKVHKTLREGAPFQEKVGFGTVERSLQRSKAKALPTIPNTVQEFVDRLEEGGELMKYYQGSVKVENSDQISSIIFAHPKLIDKFKDATEMSYDGTYKCRPSKLFKKGQVFILMFQYKSHFFPGFIILMTGASQDHYLPCLKYCHSLVPYFSLTVAIGDMETASRNIVTLTFGYLPLFLVRYCVFHYAQCNVRNIGFKGLLKQFKRKSRGGFKNLFYLWARLVMCLPFLPVNKITLAWVELKRVTFEYFEMSDNANLEKYKTYVESQWIHNNNIRHNELSVYGARIATNNAHESFNKTLNDEFERKAPNPWDFVLGTNRIFDQKVNDLNNLDADALITRKRKKEGDIKAELRRNAELEWERKNWENPVGFLKVIAGQVELQMNVIIENVYEENIVPEFLQEDENDPLAIEVPNEEPNVPICIACDSPRGAINHGVLHGVTLHLGFCEDCIKTYTVGRRCFVCQNVDVERHVQG